MKIRIVTEREILDEDFWPWIFELNQSGIPIEGAALKEKGFWQFTTNLGYTKATTRYEILK